MSWKRRPEQDRPGPQSFIYSFFHYDQRLIRPDQELQEDQDLQEHQEHVEAAFQVPGRRVRACVYSSAIQDILLSVCAVVRSRSHSHVGERALPMGIELC